MRLYPAKRWDPDNAECEQWARHPVWSAYEVSSLGQVCGPRGKILKPQVDRYGYLFVQVSNSKRQVMRSIHVLVLETFYGVRPDGAECRHLNTVKTDNRLSNLRWGTRKENYADTLARGNVRRGEKCGTSKLTKKKVLAIRSLVAKGKSRAAIATKFNVSESTIGRVVNRRTWRHVNPQTADYPMAGESRYG